MPQAGYYCVAVWKVGAADVAKAGQYQLIFEAASTPVPGDGTLPTVTAVREISPNPSTPARGSPSIWRAAVASGSRCSTCAAARCARLLAAELPAGRHEVVWDGRDDSGSGVASGTYVARLSAPGVTTARKMQLVK